MKLNQFRGNSINVNPKSITLFRKGSKAMKTKIFFTALLFAVFCLVSSSYADVPQMINYQGTLTDSVGNPLTGDYEMTFSIYDDTTGDTPLWSESQNSVTVEDGIFNVLLGIPASVFDGSTRYLGVTVGSDDEMTPRRPVVSVGYAFRSGFADVAEYAQTSEPDDDWNISGDNIYHVQGNVGIGTTSPTRKLEVNGTVEAANGFTMNGTAIGTSSDSYWSASGGGKICYNSGNVGIGTSNPQGLLDIQKAGSDTAAPRVKVKGYATDKGPSAYLHLGKSRCWYVGPNWMTLPGDTLGVVDGFGIASGTEGVAARMVFLQVGEGPDTLVPGAILFQTTDYCSTAVERMRIGSSGVDVQGDIHASGSIKSGNSITIDGTTDRITATSGRIYFDDEDLVTRGSVGIGWPGSPSYRLDVSGDVRLTGAIRDGSGNAGTNGYLLQSTGSAIQWMDPSTIDDGDWTVSGSNMYSTPSGNVGIGETNPTRKLEVAGEAEFDGALYARDATGIGLKDDGGTLGLWVKQGGNVGIGTTDPGDKMLKVNGDIEAAKYYGDGSQLEGIAGDNLGDHTATQNIKLNGNYLSGDGHNEGVYVKDNGNVGIGTSTPDYKLEVDGNAAFEQFLYCKGYPDTYIEFWENKICLYAGNVQMITANKGEGKVVVNEGSADVDFRVESDNHEGAFFVQGSDGNVGIGTATPVNRLDVQGGVAVGAFYASGIQAPVDGMIIEGDVGIGTQYPGTKLDVAGTTRTDVLEITGGSDIAEPFAMSDETQLGPGTVVVIDDQNPGNLKMSHRAYDKRVAGVISGAGGVNPGLILSQSGVLEDGQNVALTGRVWCWADASNGSIQPGDLLTTSNIPGHAMKVTDYARAQGAVIGKAMSSLEEGQGLVLVLVTLQ